MASSQASPPAPPPTRAHVPPPSAPSPTASLKQRRACHQGARVSGSGTQCFRLVLWHPVVTSRSCFAYTRPSDSLQRLSPSSSAVSSSHAVVVFRPPPSCCSGISSATVMLWRYFVRHRHAVALFRPPPSCCSVVSSRVESRMKRQSMADGIRPSTDPILPSTPSTMGWSPLSPHCQDGSGGEPCVHGPTQEPALQSALGPAPQSAPGPAPQSARWEVSVESSARIHVQGSVRGQQLVRGFARGPDCFGRARNSAPKSVGDSVLGSMSGFD